MAEKLSPPNSLIRQLVFLGVQSVGGDGCVFKHCTTLLEELLGHREFAVVFLSAVTCHGDGPTVLMFAYRDDGSEGVAEIFSIQGQAFGKLVLMGGEPLVQSVGEGLGIDAIDKVVEGVVAGHDKPPVLIAHIESDSFALALAQGTAAFPDRFDVRRSDEQAVSDEAKHGDFGIASGVAAAVIGDVIERVREAAEVLGCQGAARSGNSLTGSLLKNFRLFKKTSTRNWQNLTT